MPRHKRDHSMNKNHQCELCNKKFSRKELLDKHMKSKIHKITEKPAEKPDEEPAKPTEKQADKEPAKPTENIFICHHCSQDFSRQNNLKRHLKTHRKIPTESFTCETCNKCFFREDTCIVTLIGYSESLGN